MPKSIDATTVKTAILEGLMNVGAMQMADIRDVYYTLMERYDVPPDLIKNCVRDCPPNKWFRELFGNPVLTNNMDGVVVDWWVVTPEQNEHFNNIMLLNKIYKRSGR